MNGVCRAGATRLNPKNPSIPAKRKKRRTKTPETPVKNKPPSCAQAVWEAEELKERLLGAEGELRQAAARAEQQAAARGDAERQLAAARAHIGELQVPAADRWGC